MWIFRNTVFLALFKTILLPKLIDTACVNRQMTKLMINKAEKLKGEKWFYGYRILFTDIPFLLKYRKVLLPRPNFIIRNMVTASCHSRILSSTFFHRHFVIGVLSSAFFHPSSAICRHPVLTLQRPDINSLLEVV